MESPDIVTLTCPSCGGKLEVTRDMERFACRFCGNEHLVKRSGGVVSLQPVLDGLESIQNTAEKTASELAIMRLQKEIDSLYQALERTRESHDEERGKNLGALLLVPVVLLVGFICVGPALRDEMAKGHVMPYVVLICGGVFLVLAVVGLITGVFSSGKSREEHLRKQIAEKEEEIKRHQRIVSR